MALFTIITAVACGGGSEGTSTPSGTPTSSASQQTPTAEASVTPSPTATQASQDPTPARTPTPTVTPDATGTASANSSPTPPPTSTPVSFQTGGLVLTVIEGALPLQPGSGSAVEFKSGVDVMDFRATVTFSNPFHPDDYVWNYGLKFRESDGEYQMIVFDHQGDLNYLTGNAQTVDLVSTTDMPEFRTAAGQNNRLTLLVLEENAWVYINGNLAHTMTVGAQGISGDISLVTDIYNETTVQNASVSFTSFSINRAGQAAESASGTLERSSTDDIAVGEVSLPTSAGYAKVILVSPIAAFSGDYSFGILFRSEAAGVDNWLVFDDSKNWQHIRRTSNGMEEILAQGDAPGLKTGQGEENLIEVLSLEGQHRIYVNGQLEITLNFKQGDLPAGIAPFAGFLSSHQPVGMPTEYRDFEVWSISS